MSHIPSVCIVKQVRPQLQHFNIISTFAFKMLDLLSNRHGTTVSASHTAMLMEASQRVVLSKDWVLANQSGHWGRNIRCCSDVFSTVTSLCHFTAPSRRLLGLPVWICKKTFAKMSWFPISVLNPLQPWKQNEPKEHGGNKLVNWSSVDFDIGKFAILFSQTLLLFPPHTHRKLCQRQY